MKLLVQLRFLLGGLGICLVIYLLQFSGALQLGEFINRFHPCITSITSSTPCYIVYDFALFSGAGFVAFVLTIVLVTRTAVYFLKRRSA